MPPIVSVAIATYNQIAFLREAIDSVLLQDYPWLEIVVADDGSTDRTPALLSDYRRRFPDRFVLHLGENNLGITANHDRAFRACSGDYIAWLDGDDVMLPGKIRRQVALLEARPDVAICVSAAEVFDSSGGSTVRVARSAPRGLSEYGAAELIASGNCIVTCTAMIRRSMAPAGFDLRITAFSDFLYFAEAARCGRICALDETLARYRVHSGNSSGAAAAEHEDIWLTLAILEHRYPEYIKAIRRARALLWYRRAQGRLLCGDTGGARDALRAALSYRARPKYIARYLQLVAGRRPQLLAPGTTEMHVRGAQQRGE